MSSTQQVKMPVGKDLCPPLTGRILPSHLAAVAAAAAAVSSAFPLRACHNPALFQTQTLPATLLRPAPGPIRTAHTPVLFAPYWPLTSRAWIIASVPPQHLTACGARLMRHIAIIRKQNTSQVTMHCHFYVTHWSYKCTGEVFFIFIVVQRVRHQRKTWIILLKYAVVIIYSASRHSKLYYFPSSVKRKNWC